MDALRRAGCVFAEEEAQILRASAHSAAHLDDLLRARTAGAPLEHLVGWVDVHGLRLSVGPGVFVPRQRTRLLVRASREAVGAATGASASPVFVEAFAGVAPVATAVARTHPHAEVHATDVDEVALRYARLNLGDGAHIHRGDGLAGLPSRLRGRVAVIAAVPPYVPDSRTDLLPHEAREHEPATALLGGADGLDAVRALIVQAPGWLRPGGRLLIELHAAQLAAAVPTAEGHGFRPLRRRGEDGHTAVLDLRAG